MSSYQRILKDLGFQPYPMRVKGRSENGVPELLEEEFFLPETEWRILCISSVTRSCWFLKHEGEVLISFSALDDMASIIKRCVLGEDVSDIEEFIKELDKNRIH